MIEFSERESILFNLRFGRATINSDFDQWNEVYNSAKLLDLQYLRLKIVNPDSGFLSRFNQVKVGVSLMDIIRLYKIIMSETHANYSKARVEFRKVNPADRELLKNLLKTTYTDVPFGYYEYPRIKNDFPLELQLENISTYLSDHFSGVETGKEAYIGYLDDKPIECFASHFGNDKIATTLYAGILKEYRDKDLFQDMIRFFKALCLSKGMTKAVCGARLENLGSQYAMEKEGSICYGHEWVYMIGFLN